MLPYNRNLKHFSRDLRKSQTPTEQILWKKIRNKKLVGIQFYRQRPIFNYIADFYAPAIKLIIELDGSQHFMKEHKLNDEFRDEVLSQLNLTTIRFKNSDILYHLDKVMISIVAECRKRIEIFNNL